MQGDHVGLGEKIVKRGVFHGIGFQGLVLVLVVSEDLHAQRLRDAGRRLADAAEADDAHRFAVKLDERIVPVAPVDAALPIAVVHGLGMLADVVADFKQQGDGELADRRRAVGGDIAHRDPAILGGLNVHHIVAGCQHADVFQRRAARDCLSGKGRLVNDDSLRALDALRDFISRGSVVYSQIAQLFKALPAQIAGILGISV